MVLLVAPSRRALPAITVPARLKRLILSDRREAAEAQVQKALSGGDVDLILSTGFAASVDQRLHAGDLLVATRVFGGADVYLDLPPFQAPGAVRGSLGSLITDGADAATSRRRLPPVYALDNCGFWLARAAQAASIPCLLLRSILLEVPSAPRADVLLPQLLAGRVAGILRRPERWRELSGLLRSVERCRSQLASALAIVLVLYGHA
jgi:hypothetical protein